MISHPKLALPFFSPLSHIPAVSKSLLSLLHVFEGN